ncbi:glycosyltransferase [Candidatus Methylopumilus planktonicus]|uniref:glycosyltransferase n=1 Tax=Candidatus Methylopumilus planktonicus TaxID=1581557 RepID=UPI003BEF2D16
MKNKVKICFVATADVAITSFLANHLRQLAKLYDLTIITNTNNPDFLSQIGIEANIVQIKFSRKIDFFADFYCLIRLVKIFMRTRFASIHSITPKAGLLAIMAARICFIPSRVHTFTGQVWASEIGLKRSFLKFIDRLIGKLTTHNIVDSPSQCNFLVQQKVLTEQKSIVFGSGSVSGVDLKRFMPNEHMRFKIRLELAIPKGAFVFIYLGRLNQDKGILDLARAFTKIQNNKVFLLIVGPDEGGFVDKIKIINIHKSSYVKFVDFTNKPEDYLAASDVLCLPSYREGFGNVIIEAAAMGIPAIASNIYGISDAIINEQTGLLHAPGNIKSIFDAIEHLSTKPKLVKKYGDAAMKRVKAQFDANKISKYWCDFYLQVIGQK